jgi:2-oxoglutarate dehydrogenase complex dehydrogenase (E1) component-like enzyme
MKLHHQSEPLDAENANLSHSRFLKVKLEGASFTDVDLGRSVFTNVSLQNAKISDVNLSGATISNADLTHMTIDGIPVLDLLRAYRAAGHAQPKDAVEEPTALEVSAIKAFVPAKDFSLSKQFYQDIGFTMRSEGSGVAYFCIGQASFLLQDFYTEGLAANFMMHLLVKDVDAWWSMIEQRGIVETYGVRLWPIQVQPWHMRDFCLADPTGVLWRIGQRIR